MTALFELRILEGPNLYFPRPAIVATYDVSGVSADLVSPARPTRDLARLVRDVAHAAGIPRISVRVRPGDTETRFAVIFPWRDRAQGEALASAVAEVLDASGTAATAELVAQVSARVAATQPGPGPSAVKPKIPVVALTGTRCSKAAAAILSHVARSAGLLVGWANEDGIHVDDELVEAGDFSGPDGPRRVLAYDAVDFAVTEVSRSGILLTGVGLLSNTVSVVTDVGAEHLGEGIDTLDVLAEVKSVVAQITRKGGWAVLNADDPLVFAIRASTKAHPWVFTLNPGSEVARSVLDTGGRITTVLDARIMVVRGQRKAEELVPLATLPPAYWATDEPLRCLLAAVTAALAAGLAEDDVVKGLVGLPAEGVL